MGNMEKFTPSWIKALKLLVVNIVNLTNTIKKEGCGDGLMENIT